MGQQLNELSDIAQSQIKALTCDRMQSMRRVGARSDPLVGN
jgi:hypothetical protein